MYSIQTLLLRELMLFIIKNKVGEEEEGGMLRFSTWKSTWLTIWEASYVQNRLAVTLVPPLYLVQPTAGNDSYNCLPV